MPDTAVHWAHAATKIGCTEIDIRAVFEVEAAGRFFDSEGAVLHRFEPHKFPEGHWPRLGFDPAGLAPWKASLELSEGDRRDMFERACRVDLESAYRAASWGAPQIMGFNHQAAGYPGAKTMVDQFSLSAQAQMDGFVNLILAWKLDSAIRSRDWLRFATAYNGSGQARTYANKIERAWRRLSGKASAAVLRSGDRGAKVRKLQEALAREGYFVDVDGRFGPETTTAVRAFQRDKGLVEDGVVGANTWTAFSTTDAPGKSLEPRLGLGSKRAQAAVGATAGVGVAVSQASEVLYVAKDAADIVLPDNAAEMVQTANTQTIIIIVLGLAVAGLVGWMLYTKWKDNE